MEIELSPLLKIPKKKGKVGYRIDSIKRPGRLLNFWTLRVGAYSRWALIRGGRLFEVGAYSRWALIRGGRLFEAGRLLNFHHFRQVVSLFCNKTINNKKT